MAYKKRRPPSGRRRGQAGERIRKAEWVDPFPGILGTKPEKMVLAELYRRRIPFYFQYNVHDLPFIPGIENWRCDFAIPAFRIIIEVNGDYWHTKGDAPAKDAFRYAALEYAGWKVLVWWESDILTRLWDLCEAEPLIKNPPITGPPISMVNVNDDLRALRRMNARRRGRTNVTFKATRRRRRRDGRG